jgi:dTDP-4-amino-4,6-dideoxygalactose transaminase
MKFLPYGHQWIDEEDIEEVVKVLKSDWITTGPNIEEFENALCRYIGCKYAVAVNSGTSALDIAVQTLNFPEGSEVITSPFTFVATSNALLYNSLKPVFVDIEKNTRNINPDEIRKKIIEVGNFADMTIFSFHPVKHITTGEGGAVVTSNEEFDERLKMLRNHGIDKSALDRFGPRAGWAYDLKFLGRNYRITDFQAVLGISQLKKLDGFIKRRKEIVKMYNEAFVDVPEIETPIIKSYVKPAWHIYTVLLNGINRDEFFSKMRERNIGVNLHYIPIYRFSYYQEHFNIDSKDFPTYVINTVREMIAEKKS